MRELLSSGAAWGVRVFICSQDILTAFHAIPHEVIVAALLHLGVHAHLIRAFMLQLTGVQATMQIAGAGPSKGFGFTSGGKQWGVETPDLFNAVMEHIMEPLVEAWAQRKFGVKLTDQGLAEYVHHLVWADNVWLLAGNKKSLQIMLSDLTSSIYKAGFKSKVEKGNLNIMAAGKAQHEKQEPFSISAPNGEVLTYDWKENLEVLGELLDGSGSTEASQEHRQAQAVKLYFSYNQQFKAPSSATAKIQAWARGPQASACYGAQAWHHSEGTMEAARRWEFRWLRRALKMRKGTGEAWTDFNARTAVRIRSWAEKLTYHSSPNDSRMHLCPA